MATEQVKELIALLEKNKLSKLVLKKGDFEVHLEKGNQMIVPLPSPKAEEPRPSTAIKEVIGLAVKSPMVGTFYSSPSPDQPAFVKIGDKVSADQVVCIIEAMKVMNEVKAGVSGVVEEILVDNADPVEFGTRLIRIG